MLRGSQQDAEDPGWMGGRKGEQGHMAQSLGHLHTDARLLGGDGHLCGGPPVPSWHHTRVMTQSPKEDRSRAEGTSAETCWP